MKEKIFLNRKGTFLTPFLQKEGGKRSKAVLVPWEKMPIQMKFSESHRAMRRTKEI